MKEKNPDTMFIFRGDIEFHFDDMYVQEKGNDTILF